MYSTFLTEDVTLLLKDITGLVAPLPTEEREKMIQSGVHYSAMLPLEYVPSDSYLQEYQNALDNFSKITAAAVQVVAEKIYRLKGDELVLVSLARAGTPIAILIKRYLTKKYRLDFPHYTISIIRGRGIGGNAMKYILNRHNPAGVQFIDGWTGKGAILRELQKEISKYPAVSSNLAVLADPANITDLCGSHDDFLIASSCLNATVCGLISRTFYRKDIIKKDDFHGAAFYPELINQDRTYEFIHKIESLMSYENIPQENETYTAPNGLDEVYKIAGNFDIKDINLIKPGVGETTRVLLRRVPDMVLISDNADASRVAHIFKLAEERKVKILKFPLKRYQACGIIKNLYADI